MAVSAATPSRTQSTACPSPASPLTTLSPIIGSSSTSRMRISGVRPSLHRSRLRPRRQRILKRRRVLLPEVVLPLDVADALLEVVDAGGLGEIGVGVEHER